MMILPDDLKTAKSFDATMDAMRHERPWDAWEPAVTDDELEIDLDDAAAADLLFSSMVVDLDVAAELDLENDPEYDDWLDQIQHAAESCQEDRAAGLTLPFSAYLDREQQIQRTVDAIVDAILHKGATPEWCACTGCVMRRTERYVDTPQP